MLFDLILEGADTWPLMQRAVEHKVLFVSVRLLPGLVGR